MPNLMEGLEKFSSPFINKGNTMWWHSPEAPVINEFESKALPLILKHLQSKTGCQTVTLNTPSSGTLRILSETHCKLFVLDPQELNNTDENSNSQNELEILSQADLILCWDRLNYLTKDALFNFLMTIQKTCPHGALMHFFSYDQPEMSASPYHFDLNDNFSIKLEKTTSQVTPSYRYNFSDFKSKLYGFDAIKTCLLKNKFQENLWRKLR